MRILTYAVFIVFGSVIANAQKHIFQFGLEGAANGATPVHALDNYTTEKGYGFEQGATITCQPSTNRNTSGCSAKTPFYFSVALAEGNYRVSIRFGDLKTATSTVVKAELRRLMLEQVGWGA